MIFQTTPSQTVGPYFAIGLPWPEGPHAVDAGTPGAITITGTIYDGAGQPVPDHLIETWQADPEGRFADAHGYGGASEMTGFRGFARYGVEVGDGEYEILTVKPGRVPAGGKGRLQAPHIAVNLMARGMLQPCGDADLLRRRGRGQRTGPDPGARARRTPSHADRDARGGRLSL